MDIKDPIKPPPSLDPKLVLGLLSDLEDRLGKLKEWQNNKQRGLEVGEQRQQVMLREMELELLREHLGRRRQRLVLMRGRLKERRAASMEQIKRIKKEWEQIAAKEKRLSEQEAELSVDASGGAIVEEELLGKELERIGKREKEFVEREAGLDAAREAFEQEKREGDLRIGTQWAQLRERERAINEKDARLEVRRAAIDCEKNRHDELVQKDLERIGEQEEALGELEAELTILKEGLERGQRDDKGRIEKSWEEVRRRERELQEQEAGLAAMREAIERVGQDGGKRGEGEGRGVVEDEAEAAIKRAGLNDELTEARERAEQLEERLKGLERAIEEERERMARELSGLRSRERFWASRRLRLQQYKRLLKKKDEELGKVENAAVSSKQQYEGLLQQRALLLDVKQLLQGNEEEMVRRWAVRKASSLVVNVILGVCLAGIVCYLSAIQLVEPVWRVTSAMEVTDGSAEKFSSKEQWVDRQKKLLLCEPVLLEAQNQLRMDGLNAFENVWALRGYLERSLKMKSSADNRLELELTGTDRELMTKVLESLGRGLMGYQMIQNHQKGGTNKVRILEAATRDVKPLRNDRPWVAAGMFAGVLVVGLAGYLVLAKLLARSDRVMSGMTGSLFKELEKPANWPDA